MEIVMVTYSMTPVSGSVDEDAGSITFTITRSGDLPAETIYFSTLTNEGYSNNGDYTGIVNRAVNFSSGVSTATVSITDDSSVESNERFAGIIQRNSSDPVSTYLDRSTFTIVNDDAAPVHLPAFLLREPEVSSSLILLCQKLIGQTSALIPSQRVLHPPHVVN
ncbi:hypothetical protein KBY22_20465 [Ruegeria pomeroyi]|nr:hypothetical protein [Ruegeria pomeroyi]MCE8531754.1 hypothetical protein [Ruegeria pomeroyi]